MTADMLPWIVAAVSLIVLLGAMVVSARAQSQLRVAHEESIATKNEQIASLETQIASLRESESIRFVDRYVAAKKGLEERTANLTERLETARQQEEKLRTELNDLGLSHREREGEMERLSRDLHRTSDQIRRLEMVLREVASVGPMDVETIRTELDGRRELAAHIRERVDRLSLEEQDRVTARQNQTQRLERLNEETARVRRDIEITRAAASIVDGILGIDSEIRKRLARHASDHIEGALQSLSDASRRSPISHFVEILERQRPERLLERGAPTTATSGEQAEEVAASGAASGASPSQVASPPAGPAPAQVAGPASGAGAARVPGSASSLPAYVAKVSPPPPDHAPSATPTPRPSREQSPAPTPTPRPASAPETRGENRGGENRGGGSAEPAVGPYWTAVP